MFGGGPVRVFGYLLRKCSLHTFLCRSDTTYHEQSSPPSCPLHLLLVQINVTLTMLSAAGLAKGDIVGSSDPFAVVFVNRHRIGRTRTLFKTQNPVWDDPKEVFPLHVTVNSDYNIVVQLWDEDLGKTFWCGLTDCGLGDALQMLPCLVYENVNALVAVSNDPPAKSGLSSISFIHCTIRRNSCHCT